MTTIPRSSDSRGPWRVALLALTLGCSGLACGRGVVSQAPPPTFQSDRAWSDLERMVAIGPRPSGSKGNLALQDMLVAELTSLGVTPVRESFQDETPIGPLPFVNIFADLAGRPTPSGAPAPMVVLLSHFDTKRLGFEFVGANDGGSSTAVLLELARCLAEDPGRRRVTYRILFVDGEEAIRPDWFGDDNTYGSRHHVAEQERQGTTGRLGACVVLDMVGDRDLAFVNELNSTPDLLDLFFGAAREIGLGAHVGSGYREIKDDHLPFLAAGIPSVDLIDFNYGPSHRHWHSEGDVLANCSPESLAITGRIVLAALPALEEWVLARVASGQDAPQEGGAGGR